MPKKLSLGITNGLISGQKVHCSKDSKLFFTFTRNWVLVYAVATGVLVKKLVAHTARITGICLSRKNPFHIYSCGLDGKIILWDILRGEALWTFVIKNRDTKGEVVDDKDRGRIYRMCCSNKHIWAHVAFTKSKKHRIIQFNLKNKKQTVILDKVLLVEDMQCNTKGTSFAIVGGSQLILTKKGKFMKYELQSPATICAFHPKHDRLAVGTKGGGIFVFNNYEKGLRNPSFYHWHSHAVKALQFTNDGHLISGGEESVLVLWHLATSHTQKIARLGGPITGISVTPDDSTFLVSLHNNEIVFVNCAEEKIVKNIKGLGIARYVRGSQNWILNSTTSFDPVTQAAVLQANKHTLQFYDESRDKSLGWVDIEEKRNYIARRNTSPIEPREIDCFGLSSDGQWLSILERRTLECVLGNPFHDVILKFWKRNEGANIEFKMRTQIANPHGEKKVKIVKFRPNVYECVTCDETGEFKIWYLKDENIWHCRGIGNFRDDKILDCCFTLDGSLLMVAFETCLTFWNLEHLTLLHELPVKCEQVDVVGIQKPVVIYKNKNLVKLWDLLSFSEIHTFEEASHFGSYGDFFAIVSGNKANLYKSDSPKNSIQQWLLPKKRVKIIDGNFLLKPCGTNDLTMFGLCADKCLRFGNYLHKRWAGEEIPSLREKLTNGNSKSNDMEGKETSIFRQLYQPIISAPQKTNRKRKREETDVGPKPIKKQMIHPILSYPPHFLPALSSIFSKFLTDIANQKNKVEGSVKKEENSGKIISKKKEKVLKENNEEKKHNLLTNNDRSLTLIIKDLCRHEELKNQANWEKQIIEDFIPLP